MEAIWNGVSELVYRAVGLGGTDKSSSRQTEHNEGKRGRKITECLSQIESNLVSFQSLLVWEKPYMSVLFLVSVHAAFGLVLCMDRKFYSNVALLAMMLFVGKAWFTQIWPEIRVPQKPEDIEAENWTAVNPNVLSVPEISMYIETLLDFFYEKLNALKELRKTEPKKFCMLMTGICTTTLIIGCFVSGALILYTLVLFVTTGPGLAVYMLPRIKCDWAAYLKPQSSIEDEFIPDHSSQNIRVLRDATPNPPEIKVKAEPVVHQSQAKSEKQKPVTVVPMVQEFVTSVASSVASKMASTITHDDAYMQLNPANKNLLEFMSDRFADDDGCFELSQVPDLSQHQNMEEAAELNQESITAWLNQNRDRLSTSSTPTQSLHDRRDFTETLEQELDLLNKTMKDKDASAAADENSTSESESVISVLSQRLFSSLAQGGSSLIQAGMLHAASVVPSGDKVDQDLEDFVLLSESESD